MGTWLQSGSFVFFKICMNQIDDDLEKTLVDVIDRTPDEFSITLSSNKVSEEVIDRLH